ncbi:MULTISPECIES: type II toxin-antitoxin system RelB/DinJ family antitoxin [Kosakonia]|jgi:RHH-type rel operon transcriptional repressor/antitoxin RelB|uniref:Bifunctional antitoxin/transcriptional repressor RelB n=1 Tax=Kosakonia cowanii JCM 10956 = DSM 18146 TaxID=1300165 RepID=A0A807LDG5_9ENTR|nr:MULTISPECIES: type II toxin-antitoxin system RelB/DinJ family antitoxin [Kosakonia]MBS5773143.1 type II toxin-antitoxin system RelB/DinJ family antitoxin [Enterobacter cloacae]APZ04110.1 bifunctional antitoxin/transcriptional repressor RelB [Kosakonia cowanii JCM 10956 = DSM 18146]AST67748.1 type II toxin-antitoxin system antitoxin, RelB/DinJ family [Kosakonia cowanii]MBK0019064.1 type II toxin-antitoxin system RelB/DinJ family antitoxin [Kosakonia sp. S42]MDF2626167.1 bifunctional antitoxi
MATLNVRLDDKLKEEAWKVLEKLDITPTEAVRLLFQYVAENGRMPVKTVTVSEDEAALLEVVRERLANPQKGIKVRLDDL